MVDDTKEQVSIDEMDPVLVAEEFMPFDSTELNDELVDFACRNLNETEETRTKAMEQVKEFINRDLIAYAALDDAMLLCFLRTSRFDVIRACSMLKKSAEFLGTYKHFFHRVDSELVRRVVTSKIAGFLPYRDSNRRAIALIRVEHWDPNKLTAEDLIFGSIIAFHIFGQNAVNQVAGFVTIMDLKNLSFQQVMAMSRWLLFGVQTLQTCCPFILRELFIVHTPWLFHYSWKLVEPFIREDIKKRISIHSSKDWESLHLKIPPCLLPEDLGGQLEPYNNEHWASDIELVTKKFYDNFHLLLDREKCD